MPTSHGLRMGPLGWRAGCGATALAVALLAGCDRPPTETRRVNAECPGLERPSRGQGPAAWGAAEQVPLPPDWRIDRPRVAVEGGRVFLAFATSKRLPPAPFSEPQDVYLVTREGGRWAGPEKVSHGEQTAGEPRLGIDARGEPHLLWGERAAGEQLPPDSPPPSVTWKPNRILHRTRGPQGWLPADTLYRSPFLPYASVPWDPVRDRSGRLHVLFDAEPEPRRSPELFHWVWEVGRWLPRHSILGSDPVPIGGGRGGSQADLTVARDGRLLAVFISGAPIQGGGQDISSVFFTSSRDGGASWTAPQLISRSGLLPAFTPRIAEAGDGRIHTVWVRDTLGNMFPDVLEHSYSPDGECWTKPVRINPPTPGMPSPPSIAPDGVGGLHLLYALPTSFLDPPSYLRYSYWDGERWSEPQSLFGLDFVIPSILGLTRDAGGTLHLAVVARVGSAGGADRLYYATAPPGARRARE